MRKITNQLSNDKIDEIFKACFNFEKEEIKSVIEENKDIILNESKNYEKFIPNQSDSYNLTDFPSVKAKQIKKLYTQKFTNVEGRQYYDILIHNANGICPICGFGEPTQLDHFISKSNYPQLCITPSNMVPMCNSCNPPSKQTTSLKYEDLPFHAYYEEFKEQWMECKIVFIDNVIVDYIFSCEDTTLPLYKKYNNHLEAHKLKVRFKNLAIRELEPKFELHKELLSNSPNDLLQDIIGDINIYEKYDVNDYRSALYRALRRQFDEYCVFLESNVF